METDEKIEVEITVRCVILKRAFINVTAKEYEELVEDHSGAVIFADDQNVEWDQYQDTEEVTDVIDADDYYSGIRA